MNTRRATFAGSWYPARAADCEKEINAFLNETRFHIEPDQKFVGGIVPHAGWYFSGSLACNVIYALQDPKGGRQPDAVVVFGMHLHPRSPSFIMTEGAWETPFGDIEIESNLAKGLVERFSFTIETADRFTPDNTIELQLPFIKYFFDQSRLLPIGLPPSAIAIEIGTTVAELAKQANLDIRVIGSTDLTHYGSNYGFAPAGMGRKAYTWAKDSHDKKVIDWMTGMDTKAVISGALADHNACCPGAAAGAIAASRALGATTAKTVGYSSSYEKSPGDSFVGYAGILFGL